MAVIEHIHKNLAAYAEPKPLSKAFDAVPDMPRSYDAGALIAELERLKLFTIEHRDSGAVLVPAELASAKAEPVKAKEFATIGASVPLDFAEQVREAAKRCGLTVSAFTMQALAEKLANV